MEGNLEPNYWTRLASNGVSRRRFLRGSAFGVAGLAGAALIGCGDDEDGGGTSTPGGNGEATPSATGDATQEPQAGGTIRVATHLDLAPSAIPSTLSPANHNIYKGALDTLLRFRPEEYVADPQLADEWEFNDEYTQLRFTLKEGVSFHNGEPFNAEAVVRNFERGVDPDHPSSTARFLNWITQAETPDDRTVVLTLDQPRPSIMDVFEDVHIAEPSTFEAALRGEAVVGTGPYIFEGWEPGDRYSLVKNEDYHGRDKPILDRLEFLIMPDRSAQMINLRSGDVDVVIEPLPNEARDLADNSDYQVLTADVFPSAWYTGVDAAVITDERVRQAIAWSLDRDAVVNTSLFGFGQAISLMWPLGGPAYDEALTNHYQFDLEEAKRLLDAAGVSDLSMPFVVSENYPATHGIAEIHQADLASIGINVEIRRTEAAAYLPMVNEGRMGGMWGGILGYLSMNPGTLFVASLAARPGGTSNFDTPEYRDLVDQVTTRPPEELADTYRELNQYFVEQAFIQPVVSDAKPTVVSSRVSGFGRNRKGSPLWEYVGLNG